MEGWILAKKAPKRPKSASNSKFPSKKIKPDSIIQNEPPVVVLTDVSTKTVLFLVSGILLIGLVFLQMDQFKWLGVPFVIPERFWFGLFMVGAVFSACGLWKLPETSSKNDIPRHFAY